MAVRGKYSGEGERPVWYDTITHERVIVGSPVFFKDDFIGQALNTTHNWTLIDTAGGAETLKEDQPGGVLELALTNANEIQLAGITQNDKRHWTLNRGLIWEARMRLTVVPTGAVIVAAGLIGDTNADIDAVAESIIFRLDGSGAVTVENDDTVNETSKVATGVTMSTTSGIDANGWHTFRIDCQDYTSIKFYIDGARKASGTTFTMAQVAALQLQPCIRVSKGAAATVGTVEIDYVAVWQKRR